MSANFTKHFIWSLGLFVFIFFSASQIFNLGTSFGMAKVSPASVSQEATILLTEKTTLPIIKMAFVGDMMLDRGVKYFVYKNFNGDYGQLFVKVKDQLKSYDLLFANLEGPVSDKGIDIGGIYSFRMEPKVVPILKDVGFTIFSIANNHVFNWSEPAFVDTLQLLTASNLAYTGGGFTGDEAYRETIINIEGVRIAFLAFSEFKAGGVTSSSTFPGIAVISDNNIQQSVSRAQINNDLVIVSFHFGEEYKPLPNSYQRKYAELAIDFGADLIIGHHPHVLETLELYRGSYIIYSLGNFIFDQAFSPETMQGGLLEVEVNPNSKQIENVVLKKVNLNKFFQIESIE